MGGGARYPYPKDVWSPAGGWWTRPKNWVSNTLVIGAGAAVIVYGVWSWSAKNEQRTLAPIRPIPSRHWAREFKDGSVGVRDIE
ncbi:hypothetical protein EXIGLDRAFT_726148 [Exidia glandulosa HHB12029]|uniref:Uncharacterized protein n=1 Tax=Exidia glandulosa HHB12029 TaxID=1314781 RepID=A0A165ARI6_EXIGL|nr:hypothetical protein EXIGLDRAFT_735266 [Exidia glandulosa HHB12029]KZV85386.1 hypothetical protein EXIGLDRAFT_726148 [Exidia glandulosa HHB12029]